MENNTEESRSARGLDACFFRVERDDKIETVCFTDLTNEERDSVTDRKSEEWLRSLSYYLADVIQELGDTFDLNGIPEPIVPSK